MSLKAKRLFYGIHLRHRGLRRAHYQVAEVLLAEAAIASEQLIRLISRMTRDQKIRQYPGLLTATFQITEPAARGLKAALRIKRFHLDSQRGSHRTQRGCRTKRRAQRKRHRRSQLHQLIWPYAMRKPMQSRMRNLRSGDRRDVRVDGRNHPALRPLIASMNSSVELKPRRFMRSVPVPRHLATAASKAAISSGVAGRSSRLLRMATDGDSSVVLVASGPPEISSMCSVIFIIQVSLHLLAPAIESTIPLTQSPASSKSHPPSPSRPYPSPASAATPA